MPPFTPPRPPEEDREILLDELHALGEHAASVGAVLLLEPLNRYEDHMANTLADAAELVGEVGLDSVLVMADPFHKSIEEADPAESLRAVGPVLGHVQLGDTDRLEPGAGHLDRAALVAALDHGGCDGVLAVECGLPGPPAEVLLGVSRLLRGRCRNACLALSDHPREDTEVMDRPSRGATS